LFDNWNTAIRPYPTPPRGIGDSLHLIYEQDVESPHLSGCGNPDGDDCLPGLWNQKASHHITGGITVKYNLEPIRKFTTLRFTQCKLRHQDTHRPDVLRENHKGLFLGVFVSSLSRTGVPPLLAARTVW
jgi:hypothetical protein